MSIKGALVGLDKIKERAEAKQTNFDGESPFITLKNNDSVKVRPLQEFDDTFGSYDSRRGSIIVVEEHTNPQNFKRKAVCSFEEEGQCYGCNMAKGDDDVSKKWRGKMRFYMNVILRAADKDSEDKVKILAGGFSKQAIGNNLIEMAVELEGLTGQDLKVTRKGEKLETTYSVFPLPAKALTKAEQALELIDLSKFIRFVPFEEQAAYYTKEDDSNGGDKAGW